MKKPMKIYISHVGCKRRDIEFPSGKKITITNNVPYISSDMDELAFASRLKFVAIKDLDDKDYKDLMIHADRLPEVKRILNIEDAKPFVWKDEMEDEVRAILEERGYLIERAGENHECKCDKKIELSDKELIEILKDRGYVGIRKGKTK